VDIGVILAATAQEPGLASWLGVRVLAWLGVAAGLTFVIFVHELGHFLVAKACGVKCEKFYVGFDFFEFRIPLLGWKIPRSLLKFQWGETEYGLGSLPLGGYVKMLGQDDDPRNAEHEAERIRSAPVGEQVNEAVAGPQTVDPQHPENAPVPATTTEGKTILLDPRSYPAKSVPARMAIISAGVIMNMIFAVILAAIAYRLGVEEMPAIVGSTSPGGAAWVEGIEPGSKIIQIGRKGEPYEFLRWGDIRTTAVLNSGRDVALLVRKPDGEEKWYEVTPVKTKDSKHPIVGIGLPRKPEIEIFPEDLAHLNPRASPALLDYDRVIEAAGQKVTSGADLTAIFAQQPRGPMELKVERVPREKGKPVKNTSEQAEVSDVVLEERPMRELGVTMKIGPIVAIRKGSPADKAELQVDDLLLEVDGQPVGDPLSLSQRLTPKAGETGPLTLVVQRKDRQGQLTRRTVSLTPQPPLQSPTQMPMNPVSIESIGVALEVTSEVAEVAADGPLAGADIASGDVVTGVQFVAENDDHRKKQAKYLGDSAFDPVEIKPGKKSWPEISYLLQMVDAKTKVRLTWTRGDKTQSAIVAPRDSTTFFNDTRGVTLYFDLNEHVATDWSKAMALGFREAKDQLLQVVTILHRLITAQLSPTNLSGPLGIIGAAGTVASQGLPSLLLFLTMLSANLAVLNFLPIPALDGGHMLFLSAEAVRGKPVDEKLQIRLTVAGVVCLLSLMVFATLMDLQRFVSWFG
jgi:regulator of sigma E protease